MDDNGQSEFSTCWYLMAGQRRTCCLAPGPCYTLAPMHRMEVDVPHQLSLDEARARLDRVMEKLARDYSAVCRWDGEGRLVVQRKGLEALLRIADDRVHVAMDLGLFMRPFAGTIQAGIARQLADILA
jgi:putative polyhydroxyalkanoate system protein